LLGKAALDEMRNLSGEARAFSGGGSQELAGKLSGYVEVTIKVVKQLW
jgi:hypothetical protein